MNLSAQRMARQQPHRLTRSERVMNWLDIWGPRSGIIALVITLATLVYLIPTLDAMGREALRSCGL